jgi:DNA-binding transcriptional LysR family regulator
MQASASVIPSIVKLIAVRISPDQRLVVVGAPSYLARRGKPAHLRDLHDHDCICLRRTSGAVDRWKFVENGKDIEIAVEGHVVTNDGAFLVDAAAEGIGLAYVFESMVSALVADKCLVRVLDKYCPQIPGYFLYYPTRLNLAPKLKALIDFLKTSDGPRRGAR